MTPTSTNADIINPGIEQCIVGQSGTEKRVGDVMDSTNHIAETQYSIAAISAEPSIKSLSGLYCFELQRSYGIAPAISRSMAAVAESLYTDDDVVLESGQMKYIAISSQEPAGKPLKNCKTVSVKLTVYTLSDDCFKDQVARKKHVLERISRECYDQGGCLTIEDASKIMLTDERTIKRYIKDLKNAEILIPLRGYIQCTGRGQTHKVEIIAHYLSGKMPDEIQKRTHHSIDAICRYLNNFSRVANCHFHQKMTVIEISNVVKIAADVIEQYLILFAKHHGKSSRLETILNPLMLGEELANLKKTQKQTVGKWLMK